VLKLMNNNRPILYWDRLVLEKEKEEEEEEED